MAAADPLRELQSVHERHLDIRNDDIRQQTVNGFRRLAAVLRLIHDLKAVFLPVDLGDDSFSYILFVFGKNQFIHASSLFGFMVCCYNRAFHYNISLRI
ncbi:hypothetical protein D3C73_899780 [compost metagenome]